MTISIQSNQPKIKAKFVTLPSPWCGAICKNSMSEICIENCAIKRDCSSFNLKRTMDLATMPKFPNTATLTREERFTVVTVYLAKVIDHLQGVENKSY